MIYSATNPSDLHAQVEQKLRDNPIAGWAADGVSTSVLRARAYASGNHHLLHDTYIERAVSFAVSQLAGEQIMPLSDPVLIEADCFLVDDDGRPALDQMQAVRLPVGSPLPASVGWQFCHRCQFRLSSGLNELAGYTTQHVERFLIARDRYLVEFAVCSDCMTFLEHNFGTVERRPR